MAALTGSSKEWNDFYSYTQDCLNPNVKKDFKEVPDRWFTYNDLNPEDREGWIETYREKWDSLIQTVGRAAKPIISVVDKKLPPLSFNAPLSKNAVLDRAVEQFKQGATSQMMMDALHQLAKLPKPSSYRARVNNLIQQTPRFLSLMEKIGPEGEKIANAARDLNAIFTSPEYEVLLGTTDRKPQPAPSTILKKRREKLAAAALDNGMKVNEQALDMLQSDPHVLLKFYNFCALSLNESLSSDLSVEKRQLLWRKFCAKSKPPEVSPKADAIYAELMASKPSKAQKSEKKFSRPKSKAAAPIPLSKPTPAASASSSAAEEPVPSFSPKQLKWLSLLNQPHDPRRHPLAPRVTRWREEPSPQDVRSFVDRDPATGNTLQKYLECTDEQIHDLIAAHNLPMERILAIPDLQSAYSVPYTFLNAEGKRHQGRCFYAKVDFGGLELKGGVIRAAVDAQGVIYHIFFEERQAMQFAECTQTVLDTSALDSGTPFQQVATYAFEFENDTIVINIAGTKPEDKPIVVKIPNLLLRIND